MSDTPVFSRAAVAAPHALAAQAGRDILVQGGNALEAMIAMAAAIAVVSPHMNAVAGDGVWLVRDKAGRMHGIDASGPAGRLATIRRYRDRGHDAIPARGPDAALTVAGAVGGWELAREMAAAFGGRLPLRDLLQPAIDLAAKGYPVSASQARSLPQDVAAAKEAPGFADAFLLDGAIPKAGTLRRHEALAATLDHLASAGLPDFYRGDVGREIAADLARMGAPITREDLAGYTARLARPLSLAIPGATLWNLPPPSQGLASLLILGMFARLGVTRGEGFAHLHGLIEASRRALRIRDAIVTDPARLPRDPRECLTPEYLQAEAEAISMRRAAEAAFSPCEDETPAVWLGAIDGDGLSVSVVQSSARAYGSACVLPRTGLLWHNGGASFSLDPEALNALEPGRKPAHTLNPAMAVFEDGRVLSHGSTGGNAQPQVQAALFTRHAFGMGLAGAIEAPRWMLGRSAASPNVTLKLENRFDPSLLRALEQAGHAVELLPDAFSDASGHAGMVLRQPRNGAVAAAHDPRCEGVAEGL